MSVNSVEAFILAIDLEVHSRNTGTKYWLLSEAFALMVRKKSLGGNSGPVSPMSIKASAFVMYRCTVSVAMHSSLNSF